MNPTQQLIEERKIELIEKGIASVKSDSSMKPDEVIGSIEGFEDCRQIDFSDAEEVKKFLESKQEETQNAFNDYTEGKSTIELYWKTRYRQIQVEFVYEHLKVFSLLTEKSE